MDDSRSLYNDFSGIDLISCDMSRTDLSKIDISGSLFFQINVDNADLTPMKFSDSSWEGTKWWRARSISPGFLEYLISTQYPYANGDQYDGKIEPADYFLAVMSLCQQAGIKCSNGDIKFGYQPQQ